jgi:RNA polymerase sigma-70 factor (ECF subfamily)
VFFSTNAETPVQTQPTPAADFLTFMRAYQDMVFTTAARLAGHDAQAEDISQEVFLKAFENFAELRVSPTAGGWLKTVATRLTLNHLARYRRRWRFFSELRRDDAQEDEPDVDFPVPDTNAADIDSARRHALIEQALRALPEHQRVPLVLYHFEEMPYQDIAHELRVSLPKVKTDIQRGRLALAKTLARHGIVGAA